MTTTTTRKKKASDKSGKKICTGCGRWRAKSQFDSDSTRPDGLYSQCKDCKHTPARRKQINAVRAKAHAESLKKAKKKGKPWAAEEDRLVLTLSYREAAEKTGRTYWAVARRRFRLRHFEKGR